MNNMDYYKLEKNRDNAEIEVQRWEGYQKIMSPLSLAVVLIPITLWIVTAFSVSSLTTALLGFFIVLPITIIGLVIHAAARNSVREAHADLRAADLALNRYLMKEF